MSQEVYANIRELIGDLIGRTVVDITRHDKQEFDETGQSYVMLMFDDGKWLKVFVGDEGFVSGEGPTEEEEA